MSGPKVIRTVSIEQLREDARIQLALVADSIRLWQEASTGSDESASSRRGRLVEEQNRIEMSLQANRFSEVTTQCKAVVAAIRQDIQRFHEAHDARIARSRAQERSVRLTAKIALERSHRTVPLIPKDDQEMLEAAANGRACDVQETAKIAARWLEKIPGVERRHETDSQETLARLLSGTSRQSSAREVLRRLEAEFADPRINAADKQMAELARLGEQKAAEQFGLRLSTIVGANAASESSTRSLAFDSLGLELSRAVKLARDREELATELASEVAAATATNDLNDCEQAILNGQRALETSDLEQLRELIARIREIRKTAQRSRAATAARQLILSGLKKLGYEVREGMFATWVGKKRLAIRHPDKPGVALELAGTGDLGRMQTRMVAVEGIARDSRSDKEVEEEWCGNLKSLQEAVANAGGTVDIEKALAVGIQPLKVIPDEWHDEVTTIHKPWERERT